jgi:hypothetical protein
MITYKLFRVMKDGSIASLFINKNARHQMGVWLEAEDHPTKGYAHRFGWHSVAEPKAPHLSPYGRAWFKVEIEDYTILDKPLNQGAQWYISKRIKIIQKL